MRFLWDQITEFVGELWDVGTFFGRVAVLFFVLWPFVIAGLAGFGVNWGIVFGFGLLGPAMAFAVVFAFPLVFGIASLLGIGASAIGGAATLVAGELLWTGYCMVVPVENSWQILCFVMLAILASYFASKEEASSFAVGAHGLLNWVAIPLLTILFYFAEDPNAKHGSPKVGSIEYAASRASDLAAEKWEKFHEEDMIVLHADSTENVPFKVGKPTRLIHADSYVKRASGWQIKYDVVADQFCEVVFYEDGFRVALLPGETLIGKLKGQERDGRFRIVGTGRNPGVATVSVQRVPQPKP